MNSWLIKAGKPVGILALILGVYWIGYQVFREQFLSLFISFTMAFAGMLAIYFSLSKSDNSWNKIFLAGLGLRLLLMLAVPNLSEDFVRFLWDGELVRLGEDPYKLKPSEWIEENEDVSAIQAQLFEEMNSPDYFSVYPPLNQLIFWVSAKAMNGFVWNGYFTLRFILILFEVMTFFSLLKLMRRFEVPIRYLVLYWLNPFVILEISGNLHFEGIVLFFLLYSLIAYSKNKKFLSGISWGLAIGMKLLPLILFPAWFFFRKIKTSPFFWIGTLLALIVAFVPLVWDDAWVNFFESLKLYQGKFEFNASVYYLLREVGYWIEGYNTIGYLTKLLGIVLVIGVWCMSWRSKPQSLFKLTDLWIGIYLLYLLIQPIVHPWYLIPGLGLSVITGRTTFLLWSFSAIFSYQAYGNQANFEQPIFLTLEYFIVLIGLLWDYQPQTFNFLKKSVST